MAHEHTWQLTESGYERTWSTTIDEDTGTVTAYGNGFADFSDDGDGAELRCACGETRSVDNLTVNYL
ncbi:hypothetical protein [Gordonia sihwensis]|uniref:hypothetical protein n=1 Tax=Gordonia sihwensis TaxID=173559 RepID=UPI003D97FD13